MRLPHYLTLTLPIGGRVSRGGGKMRGQGPGAGGLGGSGGGIAGEGMAGRGPKRRLISPRLSTAALGLSKMGGHLGETGLQPRIPGLR
jgi:hypothetical protein